MNERKSEKMTLPVSLKKAERMRFEFEKAVEKCNGCKKEKTMCCPLDYCNKHYSDNKEIVAREAAEAEFASFLETARKKLIEELCDKGFCHNGVGVTDVEGNPHFCRNCKIIVAVLEGKETNGKVMKND